MNRFSLKKTVLVALVAIGGLTSVGISNADAGWYGRRCYTPSYSYCNSYSYYSPTYVRTYSPLTYDCSTSWSPCVSWNAPQYYAPVTISSNYYGGGYSCSPALYGFGGYGYGSYSTPISYGQCGW
ncbi:MAG: hypothetical protein KDB27_12680 [Planctomycetales bacterium]|nr:hypothetical protein [Planctomycetales bacterium]